MFLLSFLTNNCWNNIQTAGPIKISRNIVRWLKHTKYFNEEWHIPGDLNINLCENGTLLRENNKTIVKSTNKISSVAKKYLEFCKTLKFKQIIQSSTRVTHSTYPP